MDKRIYQVFRRTRAGAEADVLPAAQFHAKMSFFPVSKLAAELVAPSEPTPFATLSLSSLDHAMGLRFFVEMIVTYGGDHGLKEPARAIRTALAKALVHYYPVAGRLVPFGADGELEIECTGDGVWFVEAATTHYSLNDLKNLQFPLVIPKDELLPCPPPSLKPDEMILMMQVTQLKCGGFVLGIKFSHMVFDGVGVSNFLKAVADLTRGLPSPALEPVWFRDAIPAPPMYPRPPPSTVFDLVHSIRDFPSDTITKLKDDFARATAHRCTTFEVLAAVLWRCRTRAIRVDALPSGGDVHLVFPANVRQLLRGLLPPGGGFYGNCVYCLTVTASSERVAHAPLSEVVSLIREAKASLPAKFAEWAAGDFEEDPFRVPIGYDALNLSDWRTVGFYDVDYGSGAPRGVAPLNHHVFFCGGIILRGSAPADGVRYVGQAVTREHEEAFVEELKNFVQ